MLARENRGFESVYNEAGSWWLIPSGFHTAKPNWMLTVPPLLAVERKLAYKVRDFFFCLDFIKPLMALHPFPSGQLPSVQSKNRKSCLFYIMLGESAPGVLEVCLLKRACFGGGPFVPTISDVY